MDCSCKFILEKLPAKIKFLIFNRFNLAIKANGFFSILNDYISIIHAAFNSDKLLILGVSGATILPIIKLLKKK